MAYKPRIESNNLDLTSILSTINELPEAGGGGEISTLTIEERGFGWPHYVYFLDVNGQLFTPDTITLDEIYLVPRNSLVVVGYTAGGAGIFFFEGLTLLGKYGEQSGAKVYQITGSAAKLYFEL